MFISGREIETICSTYLSLNELEFDLIMQEACALGHFGAFFKAFSDIISIYKEYTNERDQNSNGSLNPSYIFPTPANILL